MLFRLRTLVFTAGLSVILFNSFTSWASSDEPKIPLQRRFSLTSDYFLNRKTNEGIVSFPLSVFELQSYFYDLIGYDSTPSERGYKFLIDVPIAIWLGSGVRLSFHEFGHKRAAEAAGYYKVWYNSKMFSTSGYWLLNVGTFLYPLSASTSWYKILNNGEVDLDRLYGPSGDELITTTAGINNSVLLANKVEEGIQLRNGHVTYLFPYLVSKLDLLFYTMVDSGEGADPSRIAAAYQQKGYNISLSQLQWMSALNLLSGTTFALVKGLVDYINHGDPVVKPIKWGQFYAPEFTTFYNAEGVSGELRLAYSIAPSTRFGLAIEKILMGDTSRMQWTPKLSYQLASILPQLTNFWAQMEMIVDKGTGGAFGFDWSPSLGKEESWTRHLSVGGKYILYNQKSLYGERNTPQYTSSGTASSFFMTLSYNY